MLIHLLLDILGLANSIIYDEMANSWIVSQSIALFVMAVS